MFKLYVVLAAFHLAAVVVTGIMWTIVDLVPDSALKANYRDIRAVHFRLLGLSLAVGVIAGLGAVAFFAACQVVSHYALDLFAGYHPQGPGGEPPLFAEGTGVLRPWLLLLAPAVGGLLSGLLVYTLAPE